MRLSKITGFENPLELGIQSIQKEITKKIRMKNLLILFGTSLLFWSCDGPEKASNEIPVIDWSQREIVLKPGDSLLTGNTYLPVYSRIYHYKREKTINLTITTSIRNVSITDTVFLKSADLFGTSGVREYSYIDSPVFIRPMETLEIVIEETEEEGGTGGNFSFEWAAKRGVAPPYFEAVMISTTGQQGISFTTRGVPVSN